MKTLTLSLIIFVSTSTYAQLRLKLDNPGLRQGDEINVRITIDEGNEKALSGQLVLTDLTDDPGEVNVGPFSFVVGNKTYTTDSVTVNVSPQLPDNILDGLWIRLVDFKEERYLIIEQRISGKWKRERKSENETSMTIGGDMQYAQLKTEILERNGLDITSTSSMSTSQVVNKNDAFGNGTVNYKRHLFQIEKTSQFTGRVKIDKNSFSDLPAHVKVEEIWIE